jgi:hypothetical protein
MSKIEGFELNSPASLGTAEINKYYATTLPNIVYSKNPTLDLADLTKTLDTRNSKYASVINNDWLKSYEVDSNSDYVREKAKCEATGSGDQFSHLSSLASSEDTSSRLRCGWVYGNPYTRGRGALGINKGPINSTASGTWIWDLNEAKKKYHADICKTVKDCGDIDADMYKGRCGWCSKYGKAVPISNNRLAYPNDSTMRCPEKKLLTTSGSCSQGFSNPSSNIQGFTNPSRCAPLPDGAFSRDCLLQKVLGAGCSDAGTMFKALQSGSDNDYLSNLRQQAAWSVYQQRAAIPLDETGLQTGKISISTALNGFNKIQDQAASSGNGALQYAARDLCYNSGTLDKYDFCQEISDTKYGPFTLDCLQKAFLKGGGQKSGRKFPSTANVSQWNSIGTWLQVKQAIKTLYNDVRSTNRITQENAMMDFYGIRLEDKKMPLGPTVTLGQHCARGAGWQKELGMGTWSAGSGFPGDASYITVPAELNAKLTNNGGQVQVVIGPGEFNFCSRGGFNDGVVKIEVYE